MLFVIIIYFVFLFILIIGYEMRCKKNNKIVFNSIVIIIFLLVFIIYCIMLVFWLGI